MPKDSPRRCTSVLGSMARPGSQAPAERAWAAAATLTNAEGTPGGTPPAQAGSKGGSSDSGDALEVPLSFPGPQALAKNSDSSDTLRCPSVLLSATSASKNKLLKYQKLKNLHNLQAAVGWKHAHSRDFVRTHTCLCTGYMYDTHTQTSAHTCTHREAHILELVDAVVRHLVHLCVPRWAH